MPEIILVFPALGGIRFGLAAPFRRVAPRVECRCQRALLLPVFRINVEERAMRSPIEEPSLVELSLDFDQRIAELAQQTDADGLVVHVGTRSAIVAQDPAQHDGGICRQVLIAQQIDKGMAVRDLKRGGHAAALDAGAQHAAFRSGTQRHAQRIKQNGFTRAGLAGQDTQSLRERHIQPVDKDDVSNAERGQHRSVKMSNPKASSTRNPPCVGVSGCAAREWHSCLRTSCCPGNCGPGRRRTSVPHR